VEGAPREDLLALEFPKHDRIRSIPASTASRFASRGGEARERERERERGRERGRERERERISERSGDSFGAIIGRVYLYIGRADAPRTERNPAGAIPPI